MSDRISGLENLKRIVKTLPNQPGVYRMVSKEGIVLYVGKAKNIVKRVTSYTQINRLNTRILHMVNQVYHVEIITTETESEALLLENNLIKSYKPPYNVLLRDDKSFPYILLTINHLFPQILKHRGNKTIKGSYFGPYASSHAVHETLTILQKVFLLRSCNDAVFENRTRPCLLYQIKRCSAPCVKYIEKNDYDVLVNQAIAFLKGESSTIQTQLAQKMHEASDKLEYEQAKIYRDRIRALTNIQSTLFIHGEGISEEADVVAVATSPKISCVQLFFYRNGQNLGNVPYFFTHDEEWSALEIISTFLGQFYDDRMPPKEIILSHKPEDQDIIQDALSQKAGRKIVFLTPKTGKKKNILDHALKNAEEALARKRQNSNNQDDLFAGLKMKFGLDFIPQRIEVYDNSHISGAQAVGCMICADKTGFLKNSYRKFNVGFKHALAPGDDYGMMREVFQRRFQRLLKEDPDREKDLWPDLVFIDGGKGQLSAVQETLIDLGINDIQLIAIAKGPERNKGREDIYMPNKDPFKLEPNDPVLYFVQRLRDEAHRFAIGSHRQKRENVLTRSQLDDIEGIGPKRKKALLLHFGSVKDIAKASVTDLKKVEGINNDIAEKIYAFFQKG